MKEVTVTRFAPSPTGSLHIGGARTALFNWLYARSMGGEFLIRVEDTDLRRSKEEFKNEIFTGLEWLGLVWDRDPISQKQNDSRHREVVEYLLEKDLAYRCYSTQEEIQDFQKQAKSKGLSSLFKSPWREETKVNKQSNNFVIRLKAPNFGQTEITDKIKGTISWKNYTLDDLVLLRQDGSPTYMLAVVVDDHDMNVSDVIRGDDHLTNTARQILIYQAMSWKEPSFAHLPLIHGTDGMKMSKRHGATSVYEYKKMGYPSEAFKNYLARLGWSYGNKEYFSMAEAVKFFSIKNVGKSPSRFDINKLNNVSKHHIKTMTKDKLSSEITAFCREEKQIALTDKQVKILNNSIDFIKDRSRNYAELFVNAQFFIKNRPIKINKDHYKIFDHIVLDLLDRLTFQLKNVSWSLENLDEELNKFVKTEAIKFHEIAQPLRVALIGEKSSPGVTTVIYLLGKRETFARINDILFAKRK